jgi:hypothetical protein
LPMYDRFNERISPALMPVVMASSTIGRSHVLCPVRSRRNELTAFHMEK